MKARNYLQSLPEKPKIPWEKLFYKADSKGMGAYMSFICRSGTWLIKITEPMDYGGIWQLMGLLTNSTEKLLHIHVSMFSCTFWSYQDLGNNFHPLQVSFKTTWINTKPIFLYWSLSYMSGANEEVKYLSVISPLSERLSVYFYRR